MFKKLNPFFEPQETPAILNAGTIFVQRDEIYISGQGMLVRAATVISVVNMPVEDLLPVFDHVSVLEKNSFDSLAAF